MVSKNDEKGPPIEKTRNRGGVRDVSYVSPATIQWAIRRAGTNADELAGRLKTVKPSQIRAWENGQSSPTFAQAEALAEKLRIPLAVLFMDTPPKLDIQVPDLRTMGAARSRALSLDFIDVLNDALVKQEWYREYLEESDAPRLTFIGRFSLKSDANAVASDMAEGLEINDEIRKRCTTWQSLLSYFVQQAERLGVLVMRGGIVKNDTSRGLDEKEFRGFAISDDLAPLVFINSRDAKAAQTFTLAHELAHIWIGQSGISNNPERKRPQQSINEIERYCNAVAAELLVPRVGFERLWLQTGEVHSRLRRIAAFYRVSTMVAIMRAYELNHLSFPEFSALMDAEYARFEKQAQEQKETEGGGNFWISFTARTGHVLQESVVQSLREGRLQYRDAASLLGLKVKTFTKFLKMRASE
jgi:Zn-dependent peptidase ImmA (M78 family)